MPKSQYTPGRRYVMQATMWLILGATVAMAAMVGKAQRKAQQVDLAPQSVTGVGISVRLPAKWRAHTRSNLDARVVAQAFEGEQGSSTRELSVLRERLPVAQSPLHYLIESFEVQLDERSAMFSEADAQLDSVKPISIGNWPGVLVAMQRTLTRRGEDALKKDLLACAVLPSGQAIVVHLEGLGLIDPTDEQVVRQVAEAIQITGEPVLSKLGERITLPGGIELSAPDGYLAVEQKDPQRLDRRLWMAPQPPSARRDAKFEWACAELVPCVIPSYDFTNPAHHAKAQATIGTMLVLRDSIWRDAKIFDDGPNLWHVDPQQLPSEAQFPARAYVIAAENGAALLAIFRGDYCSRGDFDHAWSQMVPSITLPKASDLPALETLGTKEAERIRKTGLDTLLDDREERWWLWTDQRLRTQLGWSHLAWDSKGLGATMEMRYHRGEHVMRMLDEWSVLPDGTNYRAEASRGSAGNDAPDDAIRQSLQLRAGQLSVNVYAGKSPLYQWKIPAPPQFVPGGALPMLIGKLAQSPMLLRTDSFCGHEAIGLMDPLTLIIRPEPGVLPRIEGQDKLLRCVSVQVNGTGIVSRWFYSEQGELELVDFPGEVQRVSSDLKSIRFDFSRDGAMEP